MAGTGLTPAQRRELLDHNRRGGEPNVRLRSRPTSSGGYCPSSPTAFRFARSRRNGEAATVLREGLRGARRPRGGPPVTPLGRANAWACAFSSPRVMPLLPPSRPGNGLLGGIEAKFADLLGFPLDASFGDVEAPGQQRLEGVAAGPRLALPPRPGLPSGLRPPSRSVWLIPPTCEFPTRLSSDSIAPKGRTQKRFKVRDRIAFDRGRATLERVHVSGHP
jgi:hypothetical protein